MCADNRIEKSDFESFGEQQETITTSVAGATLEDLEKTAIIEALQKYDGNLSKVATALGITRQSLYRKIEKHGLASDN